VTAFAAKLRTLIVAFPHFRNEDENASINRWICTLFQGWKPSPMTEAHKKRLNRF
jgi:hypothetical protein